MSRVCVRHVGCSVCMETVSESVKVSVCTLSSVAVGRDVSSVFAARVIALFLGSSGVGLGRDSCQTRVWSDESPPPRCQVVGLYGHSRQTALGLSLSSRLSTLEAHCRSSERLHPGSDRGRHAAFQVQWSRLPAELHFSRLPLPICACKPLNAHAPLLC